MNETQNKPRILVTAAADVGVSAPSPEPRASQRRSGLLALGSEARKGLDAYLTPLR
jgi:hypothetical protein